VEFEPVSQSELQAVEGGRINLGTPHPPPENSSHGAGYPFIDLWIHYSLTVIG
jgi:hypothetical protein